MDYYISRLNHRLGLGSPYSFHVVNVCLHAVMTLMLTYVCQTILRLPAQCCLMSGLLFAVHPIHTEAVSLSLSLALSEHSNGERFVFYSDSML